MPRNRSKIAVNRRKNAVKNTGVESVRSRRTPGAAASGAAELTVTHPNGRRWVDVICDRRANEPKRWLAIGFMNDRFALLYNITNIMRTYLRSVHSIDCPEPRTYTRYYMTRKIRETMLERSRRRFDRQSYSVETRASKRRRLEQQQRVLSETSVIDEECRDDDTVEQDLCDYTEDDE